MVVLVVVSMTLVALPLQPLTACCTVHRFSFLVAEHSMLLGSVGITGVSEDRVAAAGIGEASADSIVLVWRACPSYLAWVIMRAIFSLGGS